MNNRSTKRPNLNALYPNPLPVKVQSLPPFIPHNPLSWIQYIYQYLNQESVKQVKCKAVVQSTGGLCIVKVLEKKDQDHLWSMGFFGKGILSRSEPSWYSRTSRRLNLAGSDELPLTSEEITQARRQERKKFKEERAKIEQQVLENQYKLEKGEISVVNNQPIENTLSRPSDFLEIDVENMKTGMRAEDANIVDNDGKLIQQEFMQLMAVETLFLSVALGVLDVYDEDSNLLENYDLFKVLSKGNDDLLLCQYAVYHHFRSKGWCVKSGVKFGTDYLMYKKGPPFTHAEFTSLVVPTYQDESKNRALAPEWWWSLSIGRVIGGVKKTLVYSYVEIPNLHSHFDLKDVLKQCKVTDIVYRRWLPMRSRD